MLKQTAIHYHTLQQTATHCHNWPCTHEYCNTLQNCQTLQRNTLHHIATHCNTSPFKRAQRHLHRENFSDPTRRCLDLAYSWVARTRICPNLTIAGLTEQARACACLRPDMWSRDTFSGLWLAATRCNTLQDAYYRAGHRLELIRVVWLHTATHCNTLHHTATHCNTFQDAYYRVGHRRKDAPFFLSQTTLYFCFSCRVHFIYILQIESSSRDMTWSAFIFLRRRSSGHWCARCSLSRPADWWQRRRERRRCVCVYLCACVCVHIWMWECVCIPRALRAHRCLRETMPRPFSPCPFLS